MLNSMYIQPIYPSPTFHPAYNANILSYHSPTLTLSLHTPSPSSSSPPQPNPRPRPRPHPYRWNQKTGKSTLDLWHVKLFVFLFDVEVQLSSLCLLKHQYQLLPLRPHGYLGWWGDLQPGVCQSVMWLASLDSDSHFSGCTNLDRMQSYRTHYGIYFYI